MKKNLLVLLFSTFIIGQSQAQVDFGFEQTWGGLGNNPLGWTSANALAGSDPVVKKDQVIWHFGGTSANITTKSIPGVSSNTNGLVPDVSGLMLTGSITIFPTAGIKVGYPYSNRRDTLGFFVRYQPVNNDTGFVSVIMTKFNYTGTNKRDTIGIGVCRVAGAINNFTLMYTTIDYVVPAGVLPDTCIIIASSSDIANPQIGSSLWIDDLQWGTINTGLLETGINRAIQVLPNPASDFIAVDFGNLRSAKDLVITDISGKVIERFAVNMRKTTFSVSHLANGMYLYTVVDKNTNTLSSGKFLIQH